MSSVLLSLATALLIGCGVIRLRGTTLVAPALWALGSIVAIGGIELLAAAGRLHAGPASPVRYAAAVTVLCPMMAVLGAKRPQDRAWQWVVAALVATLWLPAASTAFVHRGESMHLSPAWLAFVAVLVLLGPLNYLPTRNWLAALLAAAGQGVLFAPYAASSAWSHQGWTEPVSLAAFLLATGLVWLRVWRIQSTPVDAQRGLLGELDAAWLRFRDAFGAFWAVRVMQRVNQGVESAGPPVVLRWDGWRGRDAAATEQPSDRPGELSVARARKSIDTVLRRFVDVDA